MDDLTFTIDGRNFNDFEGFIREMNRCFISLIGGNWNGNLDAFHDYLSWPNQPYKIRWLSSLKSQSDLGYGAMAVWLEENLRRCHLSNRISVKERLAKARKGRGQTLFDLLIEIIRENRSYVTLCLE